MSAYYNDVEPYVVAWLRNLVATGLIAPGDVDERSISEISGDDLVGYTQCHFFAGIGGWSRALRLAGWPDDRPVWTGSCPCQPFSAAGRRVGFADERHLWPEFYRIISERRPPVVFGEQVAIASNWLDLVRGDLEALDYAVGAIPLEAASAGAEHFRDRYWLVADGTRTRLALGTIPDICRKEIWNEGAPFSSCSCRPVVHPSLDGWGEEWTEHEFRSWGFTSAVADISGGQYVKCPDGKWRRLPPPGVRWLGTRISARVAKLRALGNAIDPRPASAFIAAFMECRP